MEVQYYSVNLNGKKEHSPVQICKLTALHVHALFYFMKGEHHAGAMALNGDLPSNLF